MFNLKNKYVFLFLAMVPFLANCRKDSQPSREKMTINPTGPIKNPTPAGWGPSDGGGGDICNGRLVESYRIKISEMGAFRKMVLPIFEKISSQADDKGNNSLKQVDNFKNWYLIDCALSQIPQERKGLYLESFQAAVQTNKEIFIDSKAFKAMTEEEQAKLILHEIVMGLYLIKYSTLADYLSMVSGDVKQKEMISKISQWKKFRPLPYRPLDSIDHQKIRTVTAWIWENRNDLENKLLELKNLFQNNDFDKRIQFVTLKNDYQSKIIKLKIEKIIKIFKKHQWSKLFPQYCQFDSVSLISQSKCDVEIIPANIENETVSENSVKDFRIKMKLLRHSDQKMIQEEFILPGQNSKNEFEISISSDSGPLLNNIGIISISNAGMHEFFKNPDAVKEGTKFADLFFQIDFSDEENPQIIGIQFHQYVIYQIEKELTEQGNLKIENTYANYSLIPEESDELFFENELPFLLEFKMTNSRILMHSKTISNN